MREIEVDELIKAHGENNVSVEDLVSKGVLEFRSQTSEYGVRFSLGHYLREITNARRLISSDWTNHQLRTLEYLLRLLEDRLVRGRGSLSDDWFLFRQHLHDLEKQVESIRDAIDGNLEAIREQVNQYRKQPPGAFRDRYAWISRIWEHYILPMRGVFDPDGPWERHVVAFENILRRLEEVNVPHEILVKARWVNSGLTEMIRMAQHADREGAREVWPIYESVKRDGTIARDVAHLLDAARKAHRGKNPVLDLDKYFGLEAPWGGERLIKPFDDGILYRRLRCLLDRAPTLPPSLSEDDDIPLPMILSLEDVKDALHDCGGRQVHLLDWMVETFQDVPLSALLRAYGSYVLSGAINDQGAEMAAIEHPEANIYCHSMAVEEEE